MPAVTGVRDVPSLLCLQVLWGNRNVAFVVVLPLALAAEGTSWRWVAALRPADWGAMVFIGALFVAAAAMSAAAAATAESAELGEGAAMKWHTLLQLQPFFETHCHSICCTTAACTSIN
jgi:hypothetical protein